MTGARRLLFAFLAAALRALAWAPLGLAQALDALADHCERQARGEGDPRQARPPNT